MSVSENVFTASIVLPVEGMRYELRPVDPSTGTYISKAIPQSMYDKDDSPEIEDPEDEMSEAAGQRRWAEVLQQQEQQAQLQLHQPPMSTLAATQDTNGIIDVMFIFTPQAYTSVGGTQSAMEALVAMSVQMANDAYFNTGSPLRMRSVRVAKMLDDSYVERGFNTELTRMRYSNDGYLDADMAPRASVGADVVVLFVAENTYCGLAYQTATSADYAYAVVCTQCPDSVAHEVGHTIGLMHDRVTAQNYDYKQYSFGYCWDTTPTTCSRSVMAYAGTVHAP